MLVVADLEHRGASTLLPSPISDFTEFPAERHAINSSSFETRRPVGSAVRGRRSMRASKGAMPRHVKANRREPYMFKLYSSGTFLMALHRELWKRCAINSLRPHGRSAAL